MQDALFSYTTTDDSGNSTELTDEEKEALKTTAQGLVDRVRAGEDFAAVAEELGVEAQTATFDSESTSPNEDLIAAADALANEGDVTELVETDSGIYVGELTSLLDREATDAEKETIVEQRRQDQYDSLLQEWKDAIDIEVNTRVWNKVDFIDQGGVQGFGDKARADPLELVGAGSLAGDYRAVRRFYGDHLYPGDVFFQKAAHTA